MEQTKEVVWLEYCSYCGHKHYMKLGTCSHCRYYDVAIPKFDGVTNKCRADYRCDGCVAYEMRYV